MSIGLQALVDKTKSVIAGPIAKATLEFCNSKGKMLRSMQCGFNPTEYSISQSIGYHRATGFGKPFSANQLQFGRGEHATLSVSIFVDEKSNLESSILKYGGKIYNAVKYRGFSSTPKDVKEICQFLECFLHYDDKSKTTPLIGFTWGDMRFIGKLCSINVQFIMFDRAGNPTRAKVGMQIMGDDSCFMKKDFSAGMSPGSSARQAAADQGAMNPRSLL